MTIFLELWTYLTNYEHIGPREISNAPIIHALTPMPVIISIYPRYIFYVNVQHKAVVADHAWIYMPTKPKKAAPETGTALYA